MCSRLPSPSRAVSCRELRSWLMTRSPASGSTVPARSASSSCAITASSDGFWARREMPLPVRLVSVGEAIRVLLLTGRGGRLQVGGEALGGGLGAGRDVLARPDAGRRVNVLDGAARHRYAVNL